MWVARTPVGTVGNMVHSDAHYCEVLCGVLRCAGRRNAQEARAGNRNIGREYGAGAPYPGENPFYFAVILSCNVLLDRIRINPKRQGPPMQLGR